MIATTKKLANEFRKGCEKMKKLQQQFLVLVTFLSGGVVGVFGAKVLLIVLLPLAVGWFIEYDNKKARESETKWNEQNWND